MADAARNNDKTPKGNVLPYVYTNPSKETILQQYDSVFVLSQDPPVSTTISGVDGSAVAGLSGVGSSDSSTFGGKSFNTKSAEIATHQIQRQKSSFAAMPSSPTRTRAKLSTALGGGGRGSNGDTLDAMEALTADVADLRATMAKLHQGNPGS